MHKEGYTYLHTPTLAGFDAEGAGDQFHVLSSREYEELSKKVLETFGSSSSVMIAHQHRVFKGKITEHFFNRGAFLTVSGQLHVRYELLR